MLQPCERPPPPRSAFTSHLSPLPSPDAIRDALRHVEGLGYRVAHVAPEPWVSLTEIAERLGRSRQSVKQLVAGTRGPGSFPPTAVGHGQRLRIWRWLEVLRWLVAHGYVDQEQAAAELEHARVIEAVNAILTLREHQVDPSEWGLQLG